MMNEVIRTLKQFIFFGLIGVVTLVIDVFVTYVLFHVIRLPAFLASGIGFLSGFFFNFPMNRRRVFRHSKDDRFTLKTQIILYALLSLFNLLVTSFVVDVLVTFRILEIQWAKLLITAIFAVWNFLVFKFFIFSKHPTANNINEKK